MEYESKHEDLMDCEVDEPFFEMALIAYEEAYVPSTQKMPEKGWIYDPSKGK